MIKVAWICSFSNRMVRQTVKQKSGFVGFMNRTRPILFNSDFAQWNTNAILEISAYEDIELHVICPVPFLQDEFQDELLGNVHYHFFRDERLSPLYRLATKFLKPKRREYKINRKRISTILSKIDIDIVHIIGAENTFYSKAVYDIPKSIPVIVQLQTLINDPKFRDGYVFSSKTYSQICDEEANILKHADYIGTNIQEYRRIIQTKINCDAKFVETLPAVGPRLSNAAFPKKYDCVYFSSNLDKAGDLAIEAFVRAKRKLPKIKMVMIGDVTPSYKSTLQKILISNNMLDSVEFLGRLDSYDDVLSVVQTARCALLPLKVDFIASTIRESMGLSIPTLSTITDGTPMLNENRTSLLLSTIGDHNALAGNLITLLTDSDLYNMIATNGYVTIKERYSNSAIIAKWVEVYKSILLN